MKSVVVFFLAVSLSYGYAVMAQVTYRKATPYVGLASGHQNNNPPPMFFIIDNDAGISGINSVPTFQCNSTIAPSVVIENLGSVILTTATLQYFVDGGMPQYYYWEGALPPFWMDTIVLPQISVAAGSHILNILVTEANGTIDFNGANNGSIEFNVIGTSEAVPYLQAFDEPLLPEGFFVENDNAGPTWNHFTIVSDFSSLNCMRMPFYVNDVSGDLDDLYMKNIDLSNVAEAELHFDVAYAYYSEFYWDELKVMVSGNCGNDWDVLYDKNKDDLATAPPTDISFTPSFLEWRTEAVDLTQYAGNSNVIIKFEGVSGHGNNLYLDNIAIDDNVGINDVITSNSELIVFPNPANDFVNVTLPGGNRNGNQISIFNSLGQKVFASAIVQSKPYVISIDQLMPGAYIVSSQSKDGKIFSAPLIVSR